MSRKDCGKRCGATVATILYSQAAPVPMAIRVNMLRLRDATDCAPRTKNGQPAHSTTGVANTSCTQFDCDGLSGCQSNTCPPISSATTGNVSNSPIQNCRVISMSSGLAPD